MNLAEFTNLVNAHDWRTTVLKDEGLLDWTIYIAKDAYCWCKSKVIQLPPDASPSLFLHEVAHALYQEPEGPLQNHFHSSEWATTFGRLVDRHLSTARFALDIRSALEEAQGALEIFVNYGLWLNDPDTSGIILKPPNDEDYGRAHKALETINAALGRVEARYSV